MTHLETILKYFIAIAFRVPRGEVWRNILKLIS